MVAAWPSRPPRCGCRPLVRSPQALRVPPCRSPLPRHAPSTHTTRARSYVARKLEPLSHGPFVLLWVQTQATYWQNCPSAAWLYKTYHARLPRRCAAPSPFILISFSSAPWRRPLMAASRIARSAPRRAAFSPLPKPPKPPL
jgi:hypothetical protein